MGQGSSDEKKKKEAPKTALQLQREKEREARQQTKKAKDEAKQLLKAAQQQARKKTTPQLRAPQEAADPTFDIPAEEPIDIASIDKLLADIMSGGGGGPRTVMPHVPQHDTVGSQAKSKAPLVAVSKQEKQKGGAKAEEDPLQALLRNALATGAELDDEEDIDEDDIVDDDEMDPDATRREELQAAVNSWKQKAVASRKAGDTEAAKAALQQMKKAEKELGELAEPVPVPAPSVVPKPVQQSATRSSAPPPVDSFQAMLATALATGAELDDEEDTDEDDIVDDDEMDPDATRREELQAEVNSCRQKAVASRKAGDMEAAKAAMLQMKKAEKELGELAEPVPVPNSCQQAVSNPSQDEEDAQAILVDLRGVVQEHLRLGNREAAATIMMQLKLLQQQHRSPTTTTTIESSSTTIATFETRQ